VAVLKRSAWVEALAAATGTVLVVDAWFDIVLESHADELRNSIMLAVFAELPTAAFCFWIAVRFERFLQRAVDTALHVAPAGERASEGDLVRILEIPSDGKSAGESRHTDPAS
jgi:hypothetical protein